MLEIRVENTTNKWIEHYHKMLSGKFSNFINGKWVANTLEFTPQEIDAKLSEFMGDDQFLEASYEFLNLNIVGRWSNSRKNLSIASGSGDDWDADDYPCETLAQAEKLMIERVEQLIPYRNF